MYDKFKAEYDSLVKMTCMNPLSPSDIVRMYATHMLDAHQKEVDSLKSQIKSPVAKVEGHTEYAVQMLAYDGYGEKRWWTITEWRLEKGAAINDWERFLNRNDRVNEVFGHRLVSRIVSHIKVEDDMSEDHLKEKEQK